MNHATSKYTFLYNTLHLHKTIIPWRLRRLFLLKICCKIDTVWNRRSLPPSLHCDLCTQLNAQYVQYWQNFSPWGYAYQCDTYQVRKVLGFWLWFILCLRDNYSLGFQRSEWYYGFAKVHLVFILFRYISRGTSFDVEVPSLPIL